MPSIYTIMDISRWALQSSQAQLDVVSHNVANVNTEGYSRQEAVQTTRNPEETPQGYYGRGTVLATVVQKVDKLILERLTDKEGDYAYNEARLAQLRRLEALSNEAGDLGLGAQITEFFNAWQDVANNPESSAVRQTLVDQADNLVERFNTLMGDLLSIEKDLDTYISGAAIEANAACRRIAELNEDIVQAETQGDTANDLRDERMRQITALSKIIAIDWFEDGSGAVQIQTGTGKTLVQGAYPSDKDSDPLVFGPVAGYGDSQLTWNGIILDHEEIQGGTIGAWLQVRGEDIPAMREYLNELSSAIVWEVNSQHSQGVGLDAFSEVTGTYRVTDSSLALTNSAQVELAYGDKLETGTFDLWVYEAGTQRRSTIQVLGTDSLDDIVSKINAEESGLASINSDGQLVLTAATGTEFAFANDTSNVLAVLGINTFFAGSTATSIEVNSVVGDNVRNITAGRLLEDGDHATGDNSNALDLADLKDANTMSNSSETFNESIVSWAASLGTDVNTVTNALSFSQVALEELQSQRDNVSGVNLDEELVKMIQFQRSYQMAAKLISMADELLIALMQVKS